MARSKPRRLAISVSGSSSACFCASASCVCSASTRFDICVNSTSSRRCFSTTACFSSFASVAIRRFSSRMSSTLASVPMRSVERIRSTLKDLAWPARSASVSRRTWTTAGQLLLALAEDGAGVLEVGVAELQDAVDRVGQFVRAHAGDQRLAQPVDAGLEVGGARRVRIGAPGAEAADDGRDDVDLPRRRRLAVGVAGQAELDGTCGHGAGDAPTGESHRRVIGGTRLGLETLKMLDFVVVARPPGRAGNVQSCNRGAAHGRRCRCAQRRRDAAARYRGCPTVR